MFYIPKDWIKNKNNESIIHKILNKYFYTDLNVNVDSAIKELEKIDENIIIEKIKDGTLKVN
ncbi:MAG: hypothetical protein KID00_00905 [Clostridium argentinense]|nr:hypothetical protein [Clostridium argentinense]